MDTNQYLVLERMPVRKHLILLLSLWHFIRPPAVVQCQPAITDLMLPELSKPTTNIINVSYVLKVIDTINYSKKFESYSLVVTNLLDAWDEDDIWLFRQKMLQHDMQPHILIYNDRFDGTSHLHISRILNLNSITIVFATSSKDNVLNKVSGILRDFKLAVVVVVIARVLSTDTDVMLMVSQIMRILSEAHIVNSVVVYDDTVFKFVLYPTLKVLNMSGEESRLDLNAEKKINFQGYHIRTPIKQDLPRVFQSGDSEEIHGMTGWFFEFVFTLVLGVLF